MSKGSKADNRAIHARKIFNGLAQARPNGPRPVLLKNGKVAMLSSTVYQGATEEAAGLSYFAGREISAEELIRYRKK
jgi:hypothetical protein